MEGIRNNFLNLFIPILIGKRNIHTLPSIKSCVPIFTTVHPMAFAELRQSVWFSFLSQGLSTAFVLIARSSIVPGTATLISLLYPPRTEFIIVIEPNQIKNKCNWKNNNNDLMTYQRRTPSFAISNRLFVEGSIGRYLLRNLSCER